MGWVIVVGLVLVLMGVIVAVSEDLRSGSNLDLSSLAPFQAVGSPSPAVISEVPVDTATPVPPEDTPLPPEPPTPTMEPTLGPAIETPVGPYSTLVHIMRRDETFSDLAFQYQTRVDVLLIANNLTADDIVQQGQWVVIPVGVSDPNGVPHFEIYTLEDEQSLTEIADQFRSDPGQIRWVNDLGPGDMVPAGRTLFVPVAPTAELNPIVNP